MVNELIFDGASNFQVRGAVIVDGKVNIDVMSRQIGSRCPTCNDAVFIFTITT
jgi:hypothetical protein